MCDADLAGPPPDSFGKNIEYVYKRYILLRTWLTLRQRQEVKVPAEVENLVEAVYGEAAMACGEEWNAALEQAKKQMDDDCNESEKTARSMAEFNLIDEPWIPCIALDGQSIEYGIRDTLLKAHELREICDDSPLVTVALHRLLLAILYRIHSGDQRLARACEARGQASA